MKKVICIIMLVVIVVIIKGFIPYNYNNNKVINYVTTNAESHSRCMCAWYSMRAIQKGGCFPCGIYPAYAYNKILPQLGFKEIPQQGYTPQKGDISVLPRNSRSAFGHIAIYNGQQWVSDFKQNDIYPGRYYREKGEYQIFRIKDGVHYPHVFISPLDYIDWIKTLLTNVQNIKW